MGFEVIVRPAVLPNIRPPLAQVLPPEDNPEQGMAIIKGSNPGAIGASLTWSVSVTHDLPHKETKRQYDTDRVYQKDKAGKINKSNYVDVERLKKVRMEAAEGPFRYLYAEPPPRDNVEVIETDMVRETLE